VTAAGTDASSADAAGSSNSSDGPAINDDRLSATDGHEIAPDSKARRAFWLLLLTRRLVRKTGVGSQNHTCRAARYCGHCLTWGLAKV